MDKSLKNNLYCVRRFRGRILENNIFYSFRESFLECLKYNKTIDKVTWIGRILIISIEYCGRIFAPAILYTIIVRLILLISGWC